MRPSANWQYLLLSQIVRGTFLMHPRIALSLGAHVHRILDADNQLPETSERAPFSHTVISGEGISFQVGSTNSPDNYDNIPEDSTAIFSIHGSMLKYGTWCDYGTQEIAGFMLSAVNHKNIGSIVMDIDSGGGSVSAIPPLSQVIGLARSLNKPVVSSVDLCCSAALWIAADSDRIIANNKVSAEIGSIGVMISFWDMVPHYEAEGFKFHSIYSTHSGDKNKEFELALQGKYDLIKELTLDPLALQFQQHIRERRADKLDESVKGIMTGRTFFAEDSLKYGLIDEIGDIDLAIERAQQLAQTRKFLSTK